MKCLLMNLVDVKLVKTLVRSVYNRFIFSTLVYVQSLRLKFDGKVCVDRVLYMIVRLDCLIVQQLVP